METITTEKGTEPLTNRPAQSYQGNESEKGKQLDPRQCPKDRQAGEAGPQTSSASHSTEEKTHKDQGSRPTEHQRLPQPSSVHPEDSARPSKAKTSCSVFVCLSNQVPGFVAIISLICSLEWEQQVST